MIIYRAECEDGGGPMYKLNGTPRLANWPITEQSSILCAADSYEHLKTLISNYGFNINDYYIVIYEIDKPLTYNRRNGHIEFDKNKAKEVDKWNMELMI